jgi:hypothetical protein
LTGWINTLTNADRLLATTQLNDAVSATGNPQFIHASQAAIAAGDLKRAAGDSSGAINDYKNAWMAAEQAVGKNPD